MAKYISHGPCERCGSRDNKATYSDGSSWCFGCLAFERGNKSGFVQEREHDKQNVISDLVLADDLCYDYPIPVVEWLKKYGISVEESIKANIKWSPSWEQLTFIFTDEENNVVFTQARNFNAARASKRKYYNQGSPADVMPIFHSKGHSRSLVITEDALSSLKLARQCDAMPALGTYLPARKLVALRSRGYEKLIVWLDSDKWKEAVEIATMAKWLGLSTKTIYTELDPKEYSDEQIKRYIEGLAS